MTSKNSFQKGYIELLVLQILHAKGDCYGYELSQTIKQLSNNYLSFPEGSIYPALYKLIEHQMISDYKKQVGKRLIRVYYHIEPCGQERLQELKEAFSMTTNSIQTILDYDFSQTEDSNK